MILVDSSVWIDYFNGIDAPHTAKLHHLLVSEPLATGDLILAEVLRGFRNDRDFDLARRALTSLTVVELGGEQIAVQAARDFRTLRRLGVTIRKTVEGIIATYCIAHGYRLLHNDRDFEPFARHMGLQTVPLS